MPKKTISSGVVHTVPADLKKVLSSNPDVLELWNALTELARNEWICWLTIVKKEETRADHLRQIPERLLEGERRPCCWPGCPHRNENARSGLRAGNNQAGAAACMFAGLLFRQSAKK